MKFIILFIIFIITLSNTEPTYDCVTLYEYINKNVDSNVCLTIDKNDNGSVDCEICEKQKKNGSEINVDLMDYYISKIQLNSTGFINFNDFPYFPDLDTLILNGLKHKITSENDIPTLTKNFFLRNNNYLYKLIINNSNLERISNNTKIKEIGTLDLRNNSFTEFPKELYNSERINNIIFDNNKMSGELKLLDSLVSFSGNNNFFNSIIHNNSSITELYLSNNDFNDISFDNITNLKKLKKLDLSGNKKITKIPSSIKEIFSLEELNLSNTNITTISKYIYNMTFLNNLDISNNPQLKTKIINFYKPVKCNFENTNILCYEPGSCENIDSNKYKPCTEKEIEEIKSIYIGGEYMDYNSEKSFEFSKSIIIIIIFISIILLIISIKFAQSRYKKRKFEKTRNRVIESKRKAHENDNQNLKYTENNINSEINITDNPSDIPLNELVPSNEPYIPMAEPIYETNDNKSKEKAYHDEKFIVNSPSIPTAELVRNYDNNDIYIRNTNVNNNNDILPRYSELDEHDDVEPVNDKISYELLLNSNNTR